MEMHQSLLALNWNLLFTAITVLVLFFILKHFFFEKVHKFMVEREDAVKNQLDNAAKTEAEAEAKLAGYEEKIGNAEAEGKQIIQSARKEAKIQSEKILADADVQSQQLIDHAQKEIRREQFNARKELQEEVGNLAIMAAEKIMEKELDPSSHKDIVDKIIENAGEEPWN